MIVIYVPTTQENKTGILNAYCNGRKMFQLTHYIINFSIYLVQDTGTEFCHEKTQYNDVKTKDDKSITKRQRLYST